MAGMSSIEWTQATWNPWHGCTKISPGCKNCYMFRDKVRFGQDPNIVTKSKTTFHDPLYWVEPRLIFTCSWSDWFIHSADSWRGEAWEVIRKTPHHTYQILTKRPERIVENLPHDWGDGWPNVWLGVSIENQKYVSRKDMLVTIPSKLRFISAEPLLGPIDFGSLEGIGWIITGGESGPNARSINLEWVRSIKLQCHQSKIPFFHKQNGGTKKIDGSWGGRTLDGQIWNNLPFVPLDTNT